MNIQQIHQEPNIEVGILTATSIRFEMRMPFRCAGKSYPTGCYRVEATPNRMREKNAPPFPDGTEASPRPSDEKAETVLSLEAGEWTLDYEGTPLPHQVCFQLDQVCIGIGFHWQRYESQAFEGNLKLIVRQDGRLTAVNVIPLEQYLYCVIASEMKASNGLELLKAHAVVSRSWLLAQLAARDENGRRLVSLPRPTTFDSEEEHIRWYERDAHQDFDVCADDHCQRYQGLGKVDCPQVREAIETTRGEILYTGDTICDARFHKCCGGRTERFENCWAEGEASYLQSVRDAADSIVPDSLQDDNTGDSSKDAGRMNQRFETGNGFAQTHFNPQEESLDLRQEKAAREFILNPPSSFCQTDNPLILSQIFNDYDQETPHFFRWTVHYSQEEISQLIQEKSGWDFGRIFSLKTLQRGPSGRIVKLEIVGEKKSLVIGKELEIRKFLSKSHLYSSAFTVDCEYHGSDGYPSEFILHGAGWGHGVGLCQVGAAVMAYEGYGYSSILQHYYPKNELKKIY